MGPLFCYLNIAPTGVSIQLVRSGTLFVLYVIALDETLDDFELFEAAC